MTKICIICSKFFPIVGGGETHIFQVAKGLSERDFKVTVVTNESSKAFPKDLPFDIKRIKGFNDEKINLNISAPQLYQALIDIDPQIIHIHNYEPYLIFNLFANSFKDKKVFLTIHNTPLFPKRVFGTFKNFEAEFAAARNAINIGSQKCIVVASEYYKNSIEKIAAISQNIEIIPYGVDFKLFDADLKSPLRKKFKLLKNDVLILCPSRIVVRKGIKEAVVSLSHLPKNYKLFLPASFEPKDVDYFKEIKILIIALKLQERVILADKQYTAFEMPYVYQASDIVIMPSYYEGLGFAVLEAMAMKKPVIGTNVVGLNESIKNDEDGLLIPANNIQELANAVLRLTFDHKLRDMLIENAFNKVRFEFNLNTQIDKLIHVYGF